MKKTSAKHERRKKRGPAVPKPVKWIAGLAVVGLLVYGLSQMSGVAYTEDDIGVVDFTGLTSSEKHTALVAANQARCTCGCGLNLAQCVATDSTCPIREQNIKRIRTMVEEADKPD